MEAAIYFESCLFNMFPNIYSIHYLLLHFFCFRLCIIDIQMVSSQKNLRLTESKLNTNSYLCQILYGPYNFKFLSF